MLNNDFSWFAYKLPPGKSIKTEPLRVDVQLAGHGINFRRLILCPKFSLGLPFYVKRQLWFIYLHYALLMKNVNECTLTLSEILYNNKLLYKVIIYHCFRVI